MTDGEAWRRVEGFPDYEVSDLGRVRSGKPFGGFGRRPDAPRLLKCAPNDKGYPRVVLHLHGKKHKRDVHRLVLDAFVGPRPSGMECAHANGNRQDARLANLAWKTHADNEADKVRHGSVLRGSTHGCAVLDEAKVVDIRRRKRSGERVEDLAKEHGVDASTVRLAIRKATWSHVVEV